MSLARAALRASVARPLAMRAPLRTYSSASGDAAQDAPGAKVLHKGAKRDPELYILFGIMAATFSLAGWYFTHSPTSSSSESAVAKVPGSEPWKTGKAAVYQYHPGGDESQQKREVPSALHSVIIPNVNLPRELHEQFNKYGKDGF
ncbi:hypothetical protein EJ06DRAFT_550904 [Trichodelitschia bisporula]|uniref:Uncharacterized protein n=1 Tax=Trichodelitschia bisporula TaxID=703511 RepID=A0A6G1HMR0_9PEZI|nr:hypothetical protein EJ06DRAFT_550904 [Trichodelitschia bisporula]